MCVWWDCGGQYPPITIARGEGMRAGVGATRRVVAGWTYSRTPPQPSPRGASTTTINISSCRGRGEGCRQKKQESNLLGQLLFSQQKGRRRGKAWLELGLPVPGLGGQDGMGQGSQLQELGKLCLSPAVAPSFPQPPAPAPLPFATFALYTNMSLEFK